MIFTLKSNPVKFDDLSSKEIPETSENQKRVEKAREIQLLRYKNEKFTTTPLSARQIKKYVILDEKLEKL